MDDSHSTPQDIEMAHSDDPQPTSPDLPALEPITRPNRRARVEDDDDDDRDRRHPSQRITTPLPTPDTQPRQQPTLASLFDSLGVPPPPPPPAAAGPTPANPTPPTMPQFMSGGITFSLDIGPDLAIPPNAPGGQPPFPPFSSEALREMFGIEPDVEDPDRADRLIQGLEEVPIGLVRRLERVGGSAGANGEDLSGGDSGCAVCWEKLLDDKATEEEHPKIVSLPCAHVFHADCLRPWFSRPKHTTCPTCRFNIDPEDLTFVPYSQRQRTQEQRREEAAASQTAQTPPAATPDNASATADPEQGPSDEARGRLGSPPAPGAAPASTTRRTSSEPPTGRAAPAAAPRPRPSPEIIQSFAVPGGHVVVVNHPIGIFADAQGRPTGGELYLQTQHLILPLRPLPVGADHRRLVTGQQPQEASQAPDGSQAPPPAAEVPPAASQPTSPPVQGAPNAMPRMTMPGGAQLPPGIVAFDIHLPFPIPFPPFVAQPAPQPANPAPQPSTTPQPNPRPAGTGFAGINAGQGIVPVDIGDIMRRMFAQAAAPAPAASANTAVPTHTTAAPDTTATTPPAPPTAPSNAPAEPSADAQGMPLPPLGIGIENLLRGYLNNPAFMFRLMMSAALAGAIPLNAVPGAAGGRPRGADPNAPKRQWTPPTAPGPTLRQRVERREREAGLRCYDVSCGLGPSDDEPVVALSEALTQQCSIRSGEGEGEKPVCGHTFHSSCLVSAERVALRGVDAVVVDGNVEVSCPVCRGAGVISKKEWDEGVSQLE